MSKTAIRTAKVLFEDEQYQQWNGNVDGNNAERIFVSEDVGNSRLPGVVKFVAQMYQYVSTAILPSTVILCSFFFVIAGTWIGLFQLQSVIDLFSPIDLTGVTGYTAFLLAIIYKTWYDKAQRDYRRQPTLLFESFSILKDMSGNASSFVSIKYEDDVYNMNTEVQVQCVARYKEVRVLYASLITLSLTLRMMYYNAFREDDPDIPIELYNYLKRHTVIPNMSVESFECTTRFVVEQIARARRVGALTDTAESKLMDSLDKLKDLSIRLKTMKNVKLPSIFENHLFFIVLVFFVFFVPVQMYQQTGSFISVFYPLVGYLYFGIKFYSAFVGNPFSKNARLQSNDFMTWWGNCNATIRTHAKQALELYETPKIALSTSTPTLRQRKKSRSR